MGRKIIVTNRRARRDYEILDRFEAGIALQGTEVKSLRNGKIQLTDSYADVIDGELYLVGTHISPYEHGNIQNHDPVRNRKLLMHKQEIVRIATQINEKGLTLIPLSVYFKYGRAKVELGLCRGKKAFDKRETIKKREAKREMEKAVKSAGQQ